MEDKPNINYGVMIGTEIQGRIKQKGLTQQKVAELICKKYPINVVKGKERQRKVQTTMDHISRMINGKALNLETFNLLVDILGVKRIFFE